MKKSVAVYPGTFDPLTKGHVDIVERASVLFDRIIVACARTIRKMPYLAWEERVSVIVEVLSVFDNVTVMPLEGLLVDFVKQHQATIILRGLRTAADFDYEFQLAHMNHHLSPTVETLFLPAKADYSYISGTLVREIVEWKGDVSPFVPPEVERYLKEKT